MKSGERDKGCEVCVAMPEPAYSKRGPWGQRRGGAPTAPVTNALPSIFLFICEWTVKKACKEVLGTVQHPSCQGHKVRFEHTHTHTHT